MKFTGILFCLVLTGCGLWNKSNVPADAIARVDDKFLRASDLKGLVVPGTSQEDSLQIVHNYIQDWIRQMLLLKKAEMNLSDDLKDVQKQLENYRTSLILHAYQEMVVSQYLDTSVTEQQIQEYYNANADNFSLRNNIVRADYVVFGKNHAEASKVKGWMLSTDAAKRSKFEDFCRNKALKFHLNDSSWISMDDLEKDIPFNYSSQELFLTTRNFVEQEDSSSIYLVKIYDYKIKESVSPLEFERNRIKTVLLNMRKLELLQKVEEETYNEGLEKNRFETYEK